MFKKLMLTVAALGTVLGLVTSTLPVSAIAPGAPSHNINSTCGDLSVSLTNYAASQPAQEATGYTEYNWVKHYPAYTHTEREYFKITFHGIVHQWFNVNNPPSFLSGWIFTHQTRVVVDAPAHDDFQWSQTTPDGGGWTQTGESRWIETSPAQPAKNNTVVVAIDGATVANTTFSQTYNQVFTYDDQFVAHNYTVDVTAWTGEGSFSAEGTSEPCVERKITICHRTNSTSNPYEQIEVAVSAADGIAGNSGQSPDHYGEHQGPLASSEAIAIALKQDKENWGDIIPPIGDVHDGLNWTAEGQAMWENGCNYVTQPVSDITFTVVCDESNKGYALVTFKNTGEVDGEVGLNEEAITVLAGETVTKSIATGTTGVNITIVINDTTVYNQSITCADNGEVLGDTTPTPAIKSLPYTSGDSTLATVIALAAAASLVTLISLGARRTLARKI